MRILALTLVLAAQTCATAGGPVELRTISSGAYAKSNPVAPQLIVATDQGQFDRAWAAIIGRGEAPAIDWPTETAVILLAGTKSTGGWSIIANGATIDGTTLLVDATVKGPPPRSVVIQAVTSPWALVAVKSKAFEDAKWAKR